MRPAPVPPRLQAVDLGLPSGNLWAKCNLGSNDEKEVGLYYSWGNIDGHSIDSGYNFSGLDGTEYTEPYASTPGSSINVNIQSGNASQDAARALLHSPWRMPSMEDFSELIDPANCTVQLVTNYQNSGTNGLLITSLVNGNQIFLPTAGSFNGTSLGDKSGQGLYITTTHVDSFNYRGVSFHFHGGGDPRFVDVLRYKGLNIRAIK